MNTVIYVDKALMTAIATKLVGLLSEESKGRSGGLSLNWLIMNISAESTKTVGRDIRELLPEDVAYLIYDKIQHKYQTVSQCIDAMASSGKDQLLPGSVISVQGVMSFEGFQIPHYDPFNPPNITVPTFQVHGESCFVAKITADGFTLPVYFLESAKDQICFCHQEPVEIVGITRWSPPYRPGGAKSLTKVIRGAVVMLR